MNKDYFCPAPFLGAYINENKASPCCWYDRKSLKNNLKSLNNIEEVFLGDDFENIRKRMLSGEELPECARCNKHSSSDGQAHREIWQARAKKLNFNRDKQEDTRLHSIDLYLGNECNLTCLMCSSYNSHKWIEEEKLIFSKSFSDGLSNIKIDNYDFLKGIKRLKLAGGEVLLMKEHQKILDFLINENLAPQIELVYITNATVPFKSHQKYWSYFKSVEFIFSIDGINEVYNAIRYPAKWDETEKKVSDYLNAQGPYTHGLNCVVSALNIFQLIEIDEWWKSVSDGKATYRIIDTPSYLSFNSLTDQQKSSALNTLQFFDQFKHVCDALEKSITSANSKIELESYLHKLTKIRNKDFQFLVK